MFSALKTKYKNAGITFNEHGNAWKEDRVIYQLAKDEENPTEQQIEALGRVDEFEEELPKGGIKYKKNDFLTWEYLYQMKLSSKKQKPKSPSKSRSPERKSPFKKGSKKGSSKKSPSKSPVRKSPSKSPERKSPSKSPSKSPVKSPVKIKTVWAIKYNKENDASYPEHKDFTNTLIFRKMDETPKMIAFQTDQYYATFIKLILGDSDTFLRTTKLDNKINKKLSENHVYLLNAISWNDPFDLSTVMNAIKHIEFVVCFTTEQLKYLKNSDMHGAIKLPPTFTNILAPIFLKTKAKIAISLVFHKSLEQFLEKIVEQVEKAMEEDEEEKKHSSPSPRPRSPSPKPRSPSPKPPTKKPMKKKSRKREPKMKYVPFNNVLSVVSHGVWGPYPSPNYLSY